MNSDEFRDLMTPAEVAGLLSVDPKTISRWARKGHLTAYKTPGGHHRFDRGDVSEFMDGLPPVCQRAAA